MAGITGNGITLKIISTNAVGRLKNLSMENSCAEIDTTTMDDTVGTSVPGIPSPGSITFSGNYAPTTYGELNTALMAKTTGTATITFSDNTDVTAPIYLTRLTVTGELNDAVQVEGTLKISGALTHSTS
jgi:hypothetical protein